MSNDDYIKECGINDHPNPISVENLEIITEQIKKCICDIKSSNKSHGTGFFCKLPYPDYFNFKPVLITNYHILKEDDVSDNKLIIGLPDITGFVENLYSIFIPSSEIYFIFP